MSIISISSLFAKRQTLSFQMILRGVMRFLSCGIELLKITDGEKQKARVPMKEHAPQ